ncbi:MAG: CinA family protein [Oscillospiraceae bacterium]|nr:CinA family protein [Ruminococcus sp.]MCD8346018.1 CinA family protein [Oscillospiraceae bacterium]
MISEEFRRISELEPREISTYIDKKAQNVVQYYIANKLHIATAESCTGGMLASSITSVSGASEMFECGLVTYSERIKSELLGIPMEFISEHGVVSEEVALAMARGVLKKSGADVGVGITGIAGPTGGTKEQPVGTIYVSVVSRDREITENLDLSEPRADINVRLRNRLMAVLYSLETALEVVTGRI